jgi:hypothetical protein
MLGTSEGVTDANMTQHLGVIEERTNHLLLMQAYITTRGWGERPRELERGRRGRGDTGDRWEGTQGREGKVIKNYELRYVLILCSAEQTAEMQLTVIKMPLMIN